jgi:hypothetical protein
LVNEQTAWDGLTPAMRDEWEGKALAELTDRLTAKLRPMRRPGEPPAPPTPTPKLPQS